MNFTVGVSRERGCVRLVLKGTLVNRNCVPNPIDEMTAGFGEAEAALVEPPAERPKVSRDPVVQIAVLAIAYNG